MTAIKYIGIDIIFDITIGDCFIIKLLVAEFDLKIHGIECIGMDYGKGALTIG